MVGCHHQQKAGSRDFAWAFDVIEPSWASMASVAIPVLLVKQLVGLAGPVCLAWPASQVYLQAPVDAVFKG